MTPTKRASRDAASAQQLRAAHEMHPFSRKWTNEKYPEEWIDMEWRETCIKNGIDFDAIIDFYKDVLQKVRAGKEEAKDLLDENGVWKQQVTTKHNPSKATSA